MAKMPPDANAKAIPVLRPYFSEDVSGASTPMTSTVARLVADSAVAYSLTGSTGTVSLPGGVVEYIRVQLGDVITVTGTTNITQMG